MTEVVVSEAEVEVGAADSEKDGETPDEPDGPVRRRPHDFPLSYTHSVPRSRQRSHGGPDRSHFLCSVRHATQAMRPFELSMSSRSRFRRLACVNGEEFAEEI